MEYDVYVNGELASDTCGELTKEEAIELAQEYEQEGYSLSDIEVRKVETEDLGEGNNKLKPN